MGGWLVGRSRAAATGYAIGLLAVVLVAAAALALSPFVDAKSAVLLLLGAALGLLLVEGSLIRLGVAQFRAARDRAGLGTGRSPGQFGRGPERGDEVTGKLQLNVQPVEIGSVVKAAIGTATPAANAKSLFLQLIQNPAGSSLMGDAVFLPHVFNRFSQRDSSSTRSVRGLGPGLALARQLVELHGGSIQAESPGAGQGSTFTVKFPRSPVTDTPANGRIYSQADRSAGLEEAPVLTGIRVLIVEDDDDARALVAEERIDVLLSDIEMPGTDGYPLIRELRLRPSQQGGSVPAAALTAYARTEDRLRALRAGFQLQLPKPVQPAELITVVASLATRRN
jgi:CheY-like chemotaxis protein